MKQIIAIIKEVRQALTIKGLEIDNAGESVLPFVRQAFKNRQMEVSSFENSSNLLSKDGPQQASIIAKYKKDAVELMIGIRNIRV